MDTIYQHIIFDFDGVLADSDAIRINGFRTLFRDFSADQIDALAAFCSVNGGMSRYEKIRYFFQVIRGENISSERIKQYAGRYSKIVKSDVITAPAIDGSVDFLKDFAHQYTYAIISGSDQEELRDVCRQRGLAPFFNEILGSPVSKEKNLETLIRSFQWERGNCVFIGNSVNDLYAARVAGIAFIGRNSGMTDWRAYPDVPSFDVFSELPQHLKPRGKT